MKKLSLILLAISFLGSSNLFGQKNEYGWKVGIQVGAMNYYGDLSNGLIVNKGNVFNSGKDYGASSLGAGLMLERKFSPSWGLRLDGGIGIITANDRSRNWSDELELDNPNFARSLNFRTEVRNGSLSLVYHLNNGYLLPRNSTIAPYISVGIGITDFEVRGDLYIQDSIQYHYWSDNSIRSLAESDPNADEAIVLEQDRQYETRLNGLRTEGIDYETLVWDIPVGVGIDFRVSDRMNLGIYARLRFTSTDYLDDVSGNYLKETSSELQAYASNPGNVNIERTPNRGDVDSNNDWYSFTGVQLSYRFGMRIRKFKAQRFFAYSAPEPSAAVEAVEPEIKATPLASVETTPPVATEVPRNTAPPKPTVTVKEPAPVAKVVAVPQPVKVDTAVVAISEPVKSDSAPQPLKIEHVTIVQETGKMDTMAALPLPATTPIELDTAMVITDSLPIVADSTAKMAVNDSVSVEKNSLSMGLNIAKKDTVVVIKEEKQFVPTPITIVYPEQSTRNDSQLIEMSASLRALQASLEADESETSSQLSALETELNDLKAKMQVMEVGNQQKIAAPDSQVQRQLSDIQARLNQLTAQSTKPSVSPENLALTLELDQLRIQQLQREQQQDSLEAEILRLSNEKDSTKRAQKEAEMMAMRAELNKIKAEQERANEAAELAEKARLEQQIAEMEAERLAEKQLLEAKRDAELAAFEAELEMLKEEKEALNTAVDSLSKMPKVKPVPAGPSLAGLNKTYVYFKTGSKAIMERDLGMLNNVAEQLVKFPKMTIRLTGYTDKSGSPAVNQRLSKERVESVRAYLMSKSVSADQISVEALGESSSTAQSEALDRRVELVLELPAE